MRLPRLATASMAVSALLLTGLTGCTSDSSSSSSDVVIGIDYNDASPVDIAYFRAAQLRVDQDNASGRLGRHHLVLRALVSRSDPTTTLRDLNAFADDRSVAAAIVGACDDCLTDAVEQVDKKGLPTISLSPRDSTVTTAGKNNKFIFKVGPDGTATAATLVSEMPAATTVGVLSTDDQTGQENLKALLDALSQAGFPDPGKRLVKPAADDVSEQVSALTAAKPLSLVVLTGPDQALSVAKAARAAGYKGQIYFGATAAGDLFIPAGDTTAANKVKMAFTQTLAIDDVIATTPAKAARKQWFRDYTSRYGSYSGVASFAADAVDLIANAAVKGNGDRNSIRDIIETSQTDGLSGPLRLTPENHSALSPQAMTMLVARAGRWRLES